MGILAVAEREERITYKQLEKLNEGVFSHRIIGNEIATHYDTLKFARRVFEFVKRQNLFPGFSAPSQPTVDDVVPNLPRPDFPGAVSIRGRYLFKEIPGPFGQLIDNWPVAQTSGESASAKE